MAQIDRIKEGQTLYQLDRSSLRKDYKFSYQIWELHILSIDYENNQVTASWNDAPPKVYNENQLLNWRAKKPTIDTMPLIKCKLCNDSGMLNQLERCTCVRNWDDGI